MQDPTKKDFGNFSPKSKRRRPTAREAIIDEPPVVPMSPLELVTIRQNIARDEKRFNEALAIRDRLKANPLYQPLPYVIAQHAIISQQQALVKKERTNLDKLIAGSRSEQFHYISYGEYHKKLTDCIKETDITLCLIVKIHDVFSKTYQDMLQDRESFFLLLAEFNKFEQEPIIFPIKFKAIFDAAKSINDKQAQMLKEKTRLLHQVLSQPISSEQKIIQISDVDTAYNNKLLSLNGELEQLHQKLNQEIILLGEFDLAIERFINQMQIKVDMHSRLYPKVFQNNGPEIAEFLSAPTKNTFRRLIALIDSDKHILANPERGGNRAAQLCMRERTFTLEGLNSAIATHYEKYQALEQNLIGAFAYDAATVLAAVNQAKPRFAEGDPQIRRQFVALTIEVERAVANSKRLPTIQEWMDVDDFKQHLAFLTEKLSIDIFKQEVSLWQNKLDKHLCDSKRQDDYNTLIYKLDNHAISEQGPLILAKARDIFPKLVKRDMAEMEKILALRRKNIFPIENLIAELAIEIANINEDRGLRHAARVENVAVLESIKRRFEEHKLQYLTKLLGGPSEDEQLRQFCRDANAILEDEWHNKKSLHRIVDHHQRNRLIVWLSKALEPVYHFIYGVLMQKKFYSFFKDPARKKKLDVLANNTFKTLVELPKAGAGG